MFTAKCTGVKGNWIKLCREKVATFFSAAKIFSDERFYPTHTTEFKKSEVAEKMASNNSLCNQGLLDIN